MFFEGFWFLSSPFGSFVKFQFLNISQFIIFPSIARSSFVIFKGKFIIIIIIIIISSSSICSFPLSLPVPIFFFLFSAFFEVCL